MLHCFYVVLVFSKRKLLRGAMSKQVVVLVLLEPPSLDLLVKAAAEERQPHQDQLRRARSLVDLVGRLLGMGRLFMMAAEAVAVQRPPCIHWRMAVISCPTSRAHKVLAGGTLLRRFKQKAPVGFRKPLEKGYFKEGEGGRRVLRLARPRSILGRLSQLPSM